MNLSIIRVRSIGERSSNSAPPTALSYVAIPVEGIPSAVRWLFLLFVFTVSFENVDIASSHSLPRMVGLLFFALYFFHYNPFLYKRSLPRSSAALWWFMTYLFVYTLRGFFVPAELLGDFFVTWLTLGQLLGFFWIATDLLKDTKFVKSVLVTYVIALATIALGMVLQLPGFYVEMGDGRVTVLRDNPNGLAINTAIALVIMIGLYLNKNYRHFRSKMFFLILMPPMFWVMVSTGSRTGVASFIIGCSIYLLPYWRSKRTMIAITLALLAIVAVAFMVANNPAFSERWNRSYYEGDLAGREEIFPASFEMVLERPILGWHVELLYELGLRMGLTGLVDAHNLLLHLLLEVGVVGTIPFLIGVLLCGQAAWQARRGNLGLLPLALFSSILASSLAGNTVTSKTLWLLMALTVACGSAAMGEQGRRAKRLLSGRTFANRIQKSSINYSTHPPS